MLPQHELVTLVKEFFILSTGRINKAEVIISPHFSLPLRLQNRKVF